MPNRIALDVDGVLADTMIPWLEHSNTIRSGTQISKSDITKWDFWKEFGIPARTFYAELDMCWENWESMPPTESKLYRTTSELSKIGQVDIVTARSPYSDYFVKQWLVHQGISYNKYVSVAAGPMKADLDYDVYIDDSPLNTQMFADRSKKTILYTQPWNTHIQQSKLVVRVSSLVDVVQLLCES